MGLDMYAMEVQPLTAEEKLERCIAGNSVEDPSWEIGYWRKFYPLHNWMEELYVEKGGEDEFNLVPLKLEKEDLDRLSEVINDFEYASEYQENTKHFFAKAYAALEEGNEVFYHGWY